MIQFSKLALQLSSTKILVPKPVKSLLVIVVFSKSTVDENNKLTDS